MKHGNLDLHLLKNRLMHKDSKPRIVTRSGSRPASAEQRLNELGKQLPAPPEPFGAYVEGCGLAICFF